MFILCLFCIVACTLYTEKGDLLNDMGARLSTYDIKPNVSLSTVMKVNISTIDRYNVQWADASYVQILL